MWTRVYARRGRKPKPDHLTDEDIDRFLENPEADKAVNEHLQGCGVCLVRVRRRDKQIAREKEEAAESAPVYQTIAVAALIFVILAGVGGWNVISKIIERF